LFKKIVLDNYKSFKHVEIDLTGSEKNPLPYAFIYGENGSGKSNLIESVMFLKDSVRTINIMNRLRDITDNASAKADLKSHISKFIEGSSERSPPDPNEVLEILKNLPDIVGMARSVRTVGSDKGVSVSYQFFLNGHDGHYEMRFGEDDRLIYEKLSYVVESRTKDIFEIGTSENNDASLKGDEIGQTFSPQLFKDKEYGRIISGLIQRYWGKHSFMSILDNEYFANNPQHMDKTVGTGIADVIRYFNDLVVSYNFNDGNFGKGLKDRILSNLSVGTIKPNEKAKLSVYEEALDSFFTRLYSDVKKVYYRTEPREGMLRYTLFFSKMIGGERREIDIFSESAGTKRILGLFPAFFECARGKTVFYDELDSGIHDRLVKDMISEIKGSFKGQFIVTTHNTSLLEVIGPKNIFLILIDPRGEKRILPMNRIERTQKNHNNRDRYLNGVFGATPVTGYIDFDEIVQHATHRLGGGA